MKLTYGVGSGHVLSDLQTKTIIRHLTYEDALDLMGSSDRMTYDRRKSFKKIQNREWADGVKWMI